MATRPIVNPVLKLLKSPVPKTVPGGGKNAKGIKQEFLEAKRTRLSKKIKNIDDSDIADITFSGTTHLIAKMDDDSLSPSWTPTDIFDSRSNCRIIAPAYKGFLIEVVRNKMNTLSDNILKTKKTNDLVDISRIISIEPFDAKESLRGTTTDAFWKELTIEGDSKVINIWLKPFKNKTARESLAKKLKMTFSKTDCTFGHPEFDDTWSNSDGIISPSGIDDVVNSYLLSGHAAFSLNFSKKQDLEKILSSGVIYRIEAAPSLRLASTPGRGKDPIPASISNTSPTVVIIDGGVTARSYLPLQKIPLPPLISDSDANQSHGNKVASLICHAHAWNSNRPLPELDCTFISAQAICKDSAPKSPNQRQLLQYLEKVALATSGHAKVWNLSFNQVASTGSIDEVSYLGHEVSKLARKYNILPVISAGNINHNPTRKLICPPADCEAALTVSGRTYIDKKTPLGGACKLSLKGPSPAGMTKPDLSWYSELRMIGGTIETGTSFSAPLVSSLAAHTFSNIKDATPDLVRALLINRAELFSHNNNIGWGTPWDDSDFPWFCSPGDVTLAWTSKLQPGFNYYWNDIPIPSELIKNGKFVGSVALTAILNPLVSSTVGENYFSSRLQTSLQATSIGGTTISLAGSMREDKAKEAIARSDLAKWNPVRNHYKIHKGTGVSGSTMRLNARIFTRDLYQYDMNHHSEVPPQDVAFVLTLRASDGSETLYDSTVQSMRTELESAVLNQDIHVI
jgi:hypothetical protein